MADASASSSAAGGAGAAAGSAAGPAATAAPPAAAAAPSAAQSAGSASGTPAPQSKVRGRHHNNNNNNNAHSPQDRHEPRGRKPNDQLPPSRAREVQRAFRLRRAEHLATLEERILILETENGQLRALLNLPDADRGRIGSGPTGRGKSLKEGGVPMSERVRARKEARARERLARGLPIPDDDTSDSESRGRDETMSPGVSQGGSLPNTSGRPKSSAMPQASNSSNNNPNPATTALPLFSSPTDLPAAYNFNLPTPFQLPISPEPQFDFGNSGMSNAHSNFPIFNMFDSSTPNTGASQQMTPGALQTPTDKSTPLSPGTASAANAAATAAGNPPTQPDLLTRLKACCHLSDSHVVNDPGLLIFATRLCQSFACPFGGSHPDSIPADDPNQMLLEDAWRNLKATLDPGGDVDGENRINTGRMAAELVVRAAASRGNGDWIVCRYKEGMTVKKALVLGLVQGFGGKLE